MREQTPYPVWFSRRRRNQDANLLVSSPGREKEGEGEGELATTSLEFQYLHRKSRCEMLIGGDDISSDVITLGTCFHVFFKVCLQSHSFPLCADWRKSDSSVNGEPRGNWRRKSNSRDVVAGSPSFSRPAAKALRRACLRALIKTNNTCPCKSNCAFLWRNVVTVPSRTNRHCDGSWFPCGLHHLYYPLCFFAILKELREVG